MRFSPFDDSSNAARWYPGARAGRGDIEPIILHLLQEKPMHGYEIIRTLEARSYGMWRPSAGSVYPILQLLEEQELVTSAEEDGKKVYTLTKKGTSEAKKTAWHRPWDESGHHKTIYMEIGGTMKNIFSLLKDIARQSNPKKLSQVKKVLSETRDKLDAINDLTEQ